MDLSLLSRPEMLLAHLGIESPGDIDIEAIAQFCQATVEYAPLDGCEARILGYGDRAIITVNSNGTNRGRQRFGVAHELGHWVYDRGKASFACETSTFVAAWKGENPERRANQYAADLLLPVALFQPRARRKPFTFREVGALANEFQASRTATAIRLVEYGSYLGMVVCSTAKGRLWFARSPDLPSTIWPNDEPGRQTLAYDLLSGKSVDGPVEVYASEWASYVGADRCAVKEDSIRITPNHVLSLIWWENDSELATESEDE